MIGMERGSISECAMEGTTRSMSYVQFVAARYYPVEIVQMLPDGGKVVRSAPLPPVVTTREAVVARGHRRTADGPVRSGKPKKERKCVVCGGLLRANQRKYCSDDCARKARGDGKVRTCAVCGEPLGKGQQRYCGWEWRYEAQKQRQKKNSAYIPVDLPDRPCVVCGNMMHRPARNRNYCSDECRVKGARARMKNWREENIHQKQPRICAVCGGEIVGKGVKYCTPCSGAVALQRNRERWRARNAKRKQNEKVKE